MKLSFTPRWTALAAGRCVVAGLAGGVSPPVQGPRVAIMPTPGKPLDLFAAEDQYCRGYAQQTLGPDRRGEAAVGAAVVGTILGAAIGSATSGRHYNNTGVGAATGCEGSVGALHPTSMATRARPMIRWLIKCSSPDD